MLKKINFYIGTIILTIIDQIVKLWVINNINNNSITIIKNILNFTYCENKGIAFSIGSGNVPVFIIANLFIICGLLMYYIKNKSKINGIKKIFFTMVIAGGASNLLDRIFRGYVIDFIDVTPMFNFAVFNVADIYIVLGIMGLLILVTKEILDNDKNV